MEHDQTELEAAIAGVSLSLRGYYAQVWSLQQSYVVLHAMC